MIFKNTVKILTQLNLLGITNLSYDISYGILDAVYLGNFSYTYYNPSYSDTDLENMVTNLIEMGYVATFIGNSSIEISWAL